MHSGANKVVIALLLLILLLVAAVPMMLTTNAPSKEEVSDVKRMAMAGNPVAQSRLGLMYEYGSGVKRDKVEAFKWLILAGRSGLGVNIEKKKLAQKMTREQLLESQKRANEFVPSSMIKSTSPMPGSPAQPSTSDTSTSNLNSSASSPVKIK